MGIVLAFDVDGTLDSSAGPVRVATLRHLFERGVHIVIVSPSSARPSGFLEATENSRDTNLRDARALFPSAPLYFYVSDNGDRDAARAAGFIYVDREDFAAAFEE